MATVIRGTIMQCGAGVLALFVVAAGIAAENTAGVPKSAIDALLTHSTASAATAT